MCLCEAVCVNEHARAQAPHCYCNPLKLNQILALASENKCFARMQQAEVRDKVLTKSQRYSRAGGYSGSRGLLWCTC